MTEPTLAAVFGANATQSSTQLTITKADLPTLTASANNTAESLLTAQLLQWETMLTTAAQATNPNQSITVVRGDESIVTDFTSGTKYLETPFTITLRKPYSSTPLDADDY